MDPSRPGVETRPQWPKVAGPFNVKSVKLRVFRALGPEFRGS